MTGQSIDCLVMQRYWLVGSYFVCLTFIVTSIKLPLVHCLFTPELQSELEVNAEHVCGSRRIQNFVSSLTALENCTVIEGYLQFLLIENSVRGDFEKLSFPKLREITQYLVLYRVYGLVSLSRLFPNLSVIRGQFLFYNYAFVIVEVPDIEDIGLGSLTRVGGAVRIEKNSNLCYVNTIDWFALTGIERREHFLLNNQEISQCVNMCPNNCHGMEVPLESGEVINQPLCWNQQYCQKVCPAKCAEVGGGGTCYRPKYTSDWQCCHEECLGGCWGPTAGHCMACFHVVHKGRCLNQCPNGTYEYLQRRCVTEEECRAIRNIRDSRASDQDKYVFFKILDEGRCVPDCNPGYTVDPLDRHRCLKCAGKCPRICNGLIIQNLAGAKKFKGCTKVRGILDIQIRGGFQVNAELEENLGMIEEVDGYVKVLSSYSVTSLRFLKSLRTIHGNTLYPGGHSLVVFDNENLQDLWDLTSNLTLVHGTVFFKLNPKLCLNKINSFVSHILMSDDVDPPDVSAETNGNDVSCYMSMLKLELVALTSRAAFLRWKSLNFTNSLSWVVNYRQTLDENITVSSARDTCSADLWKTIDVTNQIGNGTDMGVIVHDLEPFTKYAVYILSYTTTMSKTSAMSQILYFTTKPSEPSPARNVTAVAKYPNELHISWKPPSSPNGNITHYYVYWQPQVLSVSIFDRRNYCEGELRSRSNVKTTEIPLVDDKRNVSIGTGTGAGHCCGCPKSKEELAREEQEHRYQVEFENFLLDSLYRKRPVNMSYENFRLSVGSLPDANISVLSTPIPVSPFDSDILSLAKMTDMYSPLLGNFSETNHSEFVDGTVDLQSYEAAVVFTHNEIILTNLKHYQEYNIEVVACQEYYPGQETKSCSNRAIVSARTLPNLTADNIDQRNITVTNNTDGVNTVWIHWVDPPSPNGIVLLYELELARIDIANYKPDSHCIPYKVFQQKLGYVSQTLSPGDWSVRIRATSLFGSGNWTEYQQFYIAHPEYPSRQAVITATVAVFMSCVTIIVVLVLLALWIYRKRLNDDMNASRLQGVSINPHYDLTEEAAVYIPDEWEVPREKVKVGRTIGQGSFGMVYEGFLYDIIKDQPKLKVAVKTVNEKATGHERIAFLNEASVMKKFECHHVIKLFGVVSEGLPPLVVMELMQKGDLKSFLRSHRAEEHNPEGPLTFIQILQMAGEIADGMAYLASLKFVHRDLAARNCMVAESGTVKIGDFGMARDIYVTDYYRKGTQGLLPVRWMAPESLHDGVFITASDVWSYGIVLWEIATLAEQPYQGMTNEEVLHYVTGGSILDKPEGCSDRLYELMVKCWNHISSRRPTFLKILQYLEPEMSPGFRAVSYYHNRHIAESDNTVDTVMNTTNSSCNGNLKLRRPESDTPLYATGDRAVGLNNLQNVSPNQNSLTLPLSSYELTKPLLLGMTETSFGCHTDGSCCLSDLNKPRTGDSTESTDGGHKNGLVNGHVGTHGCRQAAAC